MNLFTSYYNNSKNIPEEYILISISGGDLPSYVEDIVDMQDMQDMQDKRLAPSLSIFQEYSKDNINKEIIYKNRFKNEILAKCDLRKILLSWISLFGEDKTYVIMCYEDNIEFCHRHIVANQFKEELNLNVRELVY